MGNQRYIKISLFLFGSLLFGYNVGVYLHELSHAIVLLWLGGSVDRIEMNPFATSYTYYASASPNPILTSWAGIALGSLLAVLVFGFCILLNNDYLISLGAMIMIGSFAMNGGYAIIDSYLTSYGDPASLIELGVPREEIAGMGILLLGILLLLTASMGETLGFQTDDGIFKRFIVLSGGIITYFSLDVFYSIFYPNSEAGAGIYAIPIAIVFVFATAVVSKFIQPAIKLQIAKPIAEMSWGLLFFTLFLGIAFVTIEFIYI